MKTFAVPYGKSVIQFHLPSTLQVDVIEPGTTTPVSDPAAFQTTLAHPLGKHKLANFPLESTIGIAINDKTRPLPQPNPLPFLLDALSEVGFSRNNIKLFVGSGTHTPMAEEYLPKILDQDIIRQHPIIVHDCDNSPLVSLGKTSYNTPIFINEDYFNCDVKICMGNIEPHHFMGFSGGVKTAAIGLAGRETINVNHGMLSHPQARSGVYHLNPMRQDIEQIGQKIPIHLCLGSVINEEKKITQIFWGGPIAVMKAAVPHIRETFGKKVSRPYDIVIASPGGHPKDINVYQAQKALTHAARITKDDGWVILLAACREGSGSQGYEDYVKKARSHQSILKDFKKGFFEVGPHKAFQIAREAVRVNIILVSDLPPKQVKKWKLTPSKPDLLEPLLQWLIEKHPPNPRIAILPAATRTMTEVMYDSK
jgi:nickel-dependent lactate racemase